MSHEYRYEIKFILNEINLTTALDWIYSHTFIREKYDGRFVNSLYLDDLYFQAVKDNLVGLSRRRKIRFRWYRDGDGIKRFALEYKNREGRLGYKEKFDLSLENRQKLLDQPICELIDSAQHLLTENPSINCLAHSYYTPVLHIEYYRQYFEDYQGVRVTFDRQVKFRSLTARGKIKEFPQITYPHIIMEIKFSPELKNYVEGILRFLPMTPKRHSKYLAGLAAFGFVSYI
ncbi:MAG: VTC domain-containing protein [Candidatus Electrothrix sp. GW3-4]|uniref:VTC domain-containing protein n=1 Tax=Candidatus Electrothrix sp. GW3-4 TaxID=3126740 RepID=UPI0030CE6462